MFNIQLDFTQKLVGEFLLLLHQYESEFGLDDVAVFVFHIKNILKKILKKFCQEVFDATLIF